MREDQEEHARETAELRRLGFEASNVDHHLFPVVPSRNLPKLHKLLERELVEPRGMIACWKEMFAIAREKDVRPENEYVAAEL